MQQSGVMDSKEFCLKWNNHHTVLVNVLDKLLEKESMCDVTLAADHQFVRVHRLVLCACSNYFEEMLSKQIDKEAFIFLKDVSFPELRALVDYMYKGEVNVAQEHLSSFLQTAEALGIKGLAQKEGASSKIKSGQNTKSAAVNQPNEPQGTSSSLTSQKHKQKHATDSSQLNQSTKPKPPPAKKAKVSSPMDQRPMDHPTTIDDPDDHFVAVDTKLEFEADEMEDELENNGSEWTSRDGEDDWSTSDFGMFTILPNSETSQSPSATVEINFAPTRSDSRLSLGDATADPSGSQPKTNNASRGKEVDDGQSRVFCPNCKRNYANKSNLYRHLRAGCGHLVYGWSADVPCEFPVFQCRLCPYKAYTKAFIDEHHQAEHRKSSGN